MKIAFLGLGIMGSRMAANLLKNKVNLTVWNRSTAKANPLIKMGAQKANTLEDAVNDTDIVFSILAKPEAVQETASRLVPAMKQNAL